MSKVIPLDDRIVIKPSEAETKTAGGIILPETAKDKPTSGTVIAVGPGKLTDDGKRIEPSVKVGDTIVYNKYSNNEIKIDGVEHKIVRESEILAKLEG